MEKESLIKKWLNSDLSKAEEQSFKALDEAQLFEEIIQEAQRFKGDDEAKVASFNEVEPLLKNKKKGRSFNWINAASKIAAVLIIGIAVYYFLDKSNIKTFTTEYAQNEMIILPDNSTVNLNELSQLEYNDSDWDANRILKLQGEAYFDVEKGMRFEVITDRGIVSVLGTEFNVLSRENMFKVSCYEGLVSVTFNNQEIRVPAGSEFMLDSDHAETIDIMVAEPYWLKNLSVFDNVPVRKVFKELEKQYKVSINYNSDIEINFTGAFEHNNLENALKSVTQPVNLSFEIINDKEVNINVNND